LVIPEKYTFISKESSKTSVDLEKNRNSDNGILFIFISLAVFSATIISYIIDLKVDYFFIHILVWILCFFIYFLIFKSKIIQSLHIIRNKIRKSTGWSPMMKLINGLCWAAPFGLGALIPSIHEYLILAGIGLGNLSGDFLARILISVAYGIGGIYSSAVKTE
jgi:hypothetical protein